MTVFTKEIRNYMVARVLNGDNFLPGCVGGIYLYETATGSDVAFILVFSSEAASLPPAEMDAGGLLWLSIYDAEYPALLDLLRNENPLVLVYNDETQHAVVETRIEPVGEGELSGRLVHLLEKRRRKKSRKPAKKP